MHDENRWCVTPTGNLFFGSFVDVTIRCRMHPASNDIFDFCYT
jgi:hypothetical protein